ncbi:MAG: DUF1080 domain-containing protein [Planctomycetia bacterium]|nr:DUF1080 domain-containing protein [Planctomycetia bacterium]
MRPCPFAFSGLLCLGLSATAPALGAADSKVGSTEEAAFKIQGEYSGKMKTADGESKLGAQVIALGDNKFHAVGYPGGLPGDGWDGASKHEVDGELQDGVVKFPGDENRGEIKDGVLRVVSANGDIHIELKKVARKSPTLGAEPPQGAIVLFDGTSAGQFSPGKMTDDGLLMAGAMSKRKFQSCQLHVEFLLPYMPTARGQGRANSGCYLQGRYEVQMLDSFGLKGENNECGGIYSIKAPDVNMCFPPLAWQTYDIDYTAAKYEDGKKVKNSTMTVKHNGVSIHSNVELPKITTAAPIQEGPEPGPIYLQDHGNPVRYRNIWLVEKP